MFEKKENKQKEAGLAHFEKKKGFMELGPRTPVFVFEWLQFAEFQILASRFLDFFRRQMTAKKSLKWMDVVQTLIATFRG